MRYTHRWSKWDDSVLLKTIKQVEKHKGTLSSGNKWYMVSDRLLHWHGKDGFKVSAAACRARYRTLTKNKDANKKNHMNIKFKNHTTHGCTVILDFGKLQFDVGTIDRTRPGSWDLYWSDENMLTNDVHGLGSLKECQDHVKNALTEDL